MAAIIAQMAAANRERKKRAVENKIFAFAANKSSVCLPRFDPKGFDPLKHNPYVRNHREKLMRQEYLGQNDR